MKTIDVQFFAAYREAAGTDRARIETGAATAGQLFEELLAAFPALEPYEARRVAINDAMAGWDDPIDDGDRVLLFPPVAGG